jgi:hypothetical protein
MEGAKLFYYEAHDLEFDGQAWRKFSHAETIPVEVIQPIRKQLEGFDVVTVWVEYSPDPEHSPLSCQKLAATIPTNSHCLLNSFEDAEAAINAGKFNGFEPGALRVFAVYSVEWPVS